MMLCIVDVLSLAETAEIRSIAESLNFVDGKTTAGWAARLVKNNEQAESNDRLHAIRRKIAERVLDNPLFQLAVRPKELTPIAISRYSPGKQYGTHVDDALMRGMRTDVSFTLFLADPTTYSGGELIIESTAGEQAFKLQAGSMVLYPSTTLHRVAAVESGTRLAGVGWARSFIRSAEQREILFDLETARRELFDLRGKSPGFDLLSKCEANLLRMWVDD